MVLEDDDPSPRDPKGELFSALNRGSSKPPGSADRTLRGGVCRLAAGNALIYTLHTLLI
jgi:hypothetical protein